MAVLAPYHVNVNCSSLEHSLTIYRDLLGFEPRTRTSPQPQPGGAFGLAVAQWDAWILHGSDDGGVVVDLLEWLVPTPARPARDRRHGFVRLIVGNAEPAAAASAFEKAGMAAHVDGASARVVDPDGTHLELRPHDGPGVIGVVIGSASIAQSQQFYRDAFGFERDAATAVVHPANGFRVEFESCDVAEPAKVANALGIFRLALLSTDIEADHRHLVELGADPLADPVALDMGPGLPSDLRASFLRDPDGSCVEFIEVPGQPGA